jgi:flavin-dependent dehydrogenase
MPADLRDPAHLIVVGASFAGLACARAAARAGLHVVLLEKKAAAGDKLHTTGLVVKDAVQDIAWLAAVPPPLVKRIEGVRLYAPDMRHVDLFAPGYFFWATDTPRLLDWMVEDVRAAGVDVRLQATFLDARREGDEWIVQSAAGELRSRYLVGADGPHSRVARALGLSANTHFLFGVEHEYAGAELAPGFLHCFIDRRLAPGYIAWVLAGVGVVQAGLARKAGHAEPSGWRPDDAMAALLDKIAPVIDLRHLQPSSVRAGLIPCGGVVRPVAASRVLLVGDAAGMVSPVTAGGIHTALKHGLAAGNAVADFLRGRAEDPSGQFVRSYPKFRLKRLLRVSFDRLQTDFAFNWLLATPPMRAAAGVIYFHHKGVFDPTAGAAPIKSPQND